MTVPRTPYAEHPIAKYLDDVIAAGRIPTGQELQALADDVASMPGSSVGPAVVRHKLEDAVHSIRRDLAQGNSGGARQTAHTVGHELYASLGDYQAPDASRDKTAREIVDSISREGY